MMTWGVRLRAVAALRPLPNAARRAVLAGGAWGIMMGLGLPVLTFVSCGTICLSDVAVTTAIAVPAGILTVGPLAAFARKPATPSTQVQ